MINFAAQTTQRHAASKASKAYQLHLAIVSFYFTTSMFFNTSTE